MQKILYYLRTRLDLIILVTSLLSTLVIWKIVVVDSKAVLEKDQQDKVQLVSKIFNSTLDKYLYVVRGTTAFFNASQLVERDEFSQFIKPYLDSDNYKSLVNISFVRLVPNSAISDFNKSLKVAGFKSASVSAAKNFSSQLVFDYSDRTGKSLLDASGGAQIYKDILANKTTVFFKDDERQVLSLVDPVYKQNKLYGLIVMDLDQKELYQESLASMPSITYANIFNGDQEIFDIKDPEGQTVEKFSTFNFLGKDLRVELVSTNQTTSISNFVLSAGVVFSFLFYAFVYALESAGIRAGDLANKMTQGLRKFKLAVDSASNHIVITDTDGRVVYANAAVQRITGFEPSEVLGQTPRLWGKQMPADFYKHMWDEIKNQRHTFHGELKNKRKNGEIYDAMATISPIIDEHNELLGFVGVEEDITDRKKFELSLQKQKELIEKEVNTRTHELLEEKSKMASVIEALSRAHVMFDLEGKVALVNTNTTKLLGEVEGGWTMEILQAKLGKEFDVRAAFQKCLADKTITTYPNFIWGEKYLQVRMNPVFSMVGQKTLTGVLTIIADVTDSVVLERSRDEFFSIASHELRTPLTAIRGNTSMILDYFAKDLKDPQLKEMIADTHESSIRLIKIVNDFLDLSRLEQGRIVYKIEKVDLAGAIKQVVEELKESAEGQGSKIETKLGTKLFAKADSAKVHEVLVNLVGNAIKFTKKGTIKISAKTVDGQVQVEIADSGTGIPQENQALLFRKFQQAGSSIFTRDTTQGTGLGLYISKLIIDGLGGKIWLKSSEVKKGSVFAFSLPIG